MRTIGSKSSDLIYLHRIEKKMRKEEQSARLSTFSRVEIRFMVECRAYLPFLVTPHKFMIPVSGCIVSSLENPKALKLG